MTTTGMQFDAALIDLWTGGTANHVHWVSQFLKYCIIVSFRISLSKLVPMDVTKYKSIQVQPCYKQIF